MKEVFELVERMCAMQSELNIHTCGDNWKSGVTNKGRSINWLLYARMEAAELIESIPSYKHWKDLDGKSDIENIKIEIVDIWHFVMSHALLTHTGSRIASVIQQVATNLPAIREPSTDKRLIDVTDELIKTSYDKNYLGIDRLLFVFIQLLNNAGMSIDDLYNLYVIKNTLNKFRQNNGYKENTYYKVLAGNEDNVNIVNVASGLKSAYTPDELYTEFEIFYKKESAFIHGESINHTK